MRHISSHDINVVRAVGFLFVGDTSRARGADHPPFRRRPLSIYKPHKQQQQQQ
jgi:hypothetical protein